MQDRKDRQANMSFDGYLKLFQLALVSKISTNSSHAPVFIHVKLFNSRKPQLDKYDMILVDEAQDLTPGCSFSQLNCSFSHVLALCDLLL